MKNEIKILIVIISLVVIGSIFTIFILNKNKSEEIKNENIIISETENEEILDECTEEYEISKAEEIKEVNSSEEKVSANALLILKKFYINCEHTINEYVETPKEIVNMTEEEVQAEYPEWEVIGFSPTEVILYKEIAGNCNEHYLIKVEDGKVVIYNILDNDELELKEKTDIAAEYLPETDLINMQEGIKIFGKEELNQIMEDFE